MNPRFPRLGPDDDFGVILPDGTWSLDAPAVERFNAVRRELNRLRQWHVQAPLTLSDTASGIGLGAQIPRGLFVLLSGAGPTYTGAETIPTTGGSWVAGPRTGLTVYEVNGVTGLSGKRLWVEPDGFGAYRGQAIRYGGCKLSGHIVGCSGHNYPDGATVVLKQGSTTIATTTSDSGGMYQFTGVSAGSGYTLVVTASAQAARFTVTTSASFSITCPSTVQDVTLGVATGYVCTGCGPYPWPKTLFFTDTYGTVTLTWRLVGGVNVWFGCQTAALPTACTSSGTAPFCDPGIAGNTALGYQFIPGGTLQMLISAASVGGGCCPGVPSDCTFDFTSGGCAFSGDSSTGPSCQSTVPVNQSGTFKSSAYSSGVPSCTALTSSAFTLTE